MERAAERRQVEGATILGLAPHTYFSFHKVRAAWVIQTPERVMMPDEIAVEILKLVDGARAVDTIIDELTRRFSAPRELIAADVLAMLQDLADKGVLR